MESGKQKKSINSILRTKWKMIHCSQGLRLITES